MRTRSGLIVRRTLSNTSLTDRRRLSCRMSRQCGMSCRPGDDLLYDINSPGSRDVECESIVICAIVNLARISNYLKVHVTCITWLYLSHGWEFPAGVTFRPAPNED